MIDFTPEDVALIKSTKERAGRFAARRLMSALALGYDDAVELDGASFAEEYAPLDVDPSPKELDRLGLHTALTDPHAVRKFAIEVSRDSDRVDALVAELATLTPQQRMTLGMCLADRDSFKAAPPALKQWLKAQDDKGVVILWILLFAELPLPCRPSSSGILDGMRNDYAPSLEPNAAEAVARILGLADDGETVDFTSERWRAMASEGED
ncbi:hypothetical protein P3T40_003545 [Paraburkholderia sp. EB58]|uniref:hypothetical protein n=1 Tax=Paraburkholderia sp. EB58 TaxID=3035125 RepID=UPI003D2627B6